MSAIPYDADVSHPALLTFRWTYDEAGGEATAAGDCPVCGCAMTRTWISGQPLTAKGGFLGRRKKPGPEPFHTPCRCETLHVGRPAGDRFGCGALLAIAPPQITANGTAP